MLNEDINTGFVIGYRMHVGGRQRGRWQKIDGFVTTLDKLNPYDQAKIMFGDDPYDLKIILRKNKMAKRFDKAKNL